MTTQNAYVTLQDYKTWTTARGSSMATDPVDDAAIESILLGVSRYIERQSGKRFTPYIETRYFDTPDDLRLLVLDEDLLEVISITNGNGTAVASTEYILWDAGEKRNRTPYRYIRIKDTSTSYWTLDSAGGKYGVISVLGIWGRHNRYSTDAWATGSAVNEVGGLDASETVWTVDSGALFAIGQIIRVDNEFGYVSGVSTNDVTVAARGANGSTAAAHDDDEAVTIWQVQDDIKDICLQIAQNVYSMRSGQSSSGRITITAGGVVIRPEEVSAMAQAVIESYRSRT